MNRAPLSPASALIAHIEPLVEDRRVLVIGNAERSIAEHLLDRGARLVQLLDPDPKRIAQAAAQNSERRLTFAQLTNSSLRDGSVDLIIVEDLALVDDWSDLISGIAKTMSNRSIAIFCASNPDATTGLLGARPGAVDYDDLADAAEAQFEEVWMLGQAPFVGYSVVQLGLDHPPEPALDNAFLEGEGEAPDFYLALCGTEETLSELSLEDMTIVQLPAARFVEDSREIHRDSERRAARRIEALEGDIAALKRKGQDKKIEQLTSDLDKRDAWIRQLEARAESADTRADDAEAEYEELEQELETTHAAFVKARDRAARVDALEKQLASAKQEAEEGAHHAAGLTALEAEITSLDQKRVSLETALAEKKRAQEKLEKRLAEQEHEIDDLHDHLDETEAKLRTAESKLSDDQGPTMTEVERDLRGLEDQLQKRGERIAELERQLQKLTTFAKTLTAELSEKAPSESPAPTAELEQLAKALAEREADLVAAQWTIGQLKQSQGKN
jgi:predicted  nucleic acid-binding Zn-ribbon protein